MLFVLPPDVVVVPVGSLSQTFRKQIDCGEGDYAVSRPRMRRPTKILDAGSADLLEHFRKPSSIVDAVLCHCRRRGLDPQQTLDQAFEALQSLVAGEVLVPAGAAAAETVRASFVAGMCLGAFEIVRLVQALEDSELYEALGATGERVALKVLRPSATDQLREALEREAAVLAYLGGSCSPRLRARGVAADRDFIALDWVSGVHVTSAAQQLRSRDRRRLHGLCARLLRAFAELHDSGVVHGDIHPGNILVRQDGSVYVLDFGRSRFAAAGHRFPSPPRAGIGYYYEPEMAAALLRGEHPPEASEQGEQFALAALVYFLLAGSHYQDFSLQQPDLLRQVSSPQPIPFARRGLPPSPRVEAVLGRALSKQPEDRYDSVADFAAAFESVAPRRVSSQIRCGESDRLIGELGFDTALFRSGIQRAPAASLAFGAAGLAFLIWRAAIVRDEPRLIALADAWAERIDPSSAAGFSPEAGAASPFHGRAGVFLTRALIADSRCDRRAWNTSVRGYLECVSQAYPQVDVLLGSAGALIGATSLPDSRLQTWMRGELERFTFEPGPSGMAHGAAGRVYAAIRSSQALNLPPGPAVIEQLWRLTDEPPLDAPGWCRGRAGMVYLWALAHRLLADERFLLLGERDALGAFRHEDTNPDICCGLAGRALALLHWYQHTGEAVWLRRSRALTRRAEQATPFLEHRYSLFKGAAGVALLGIEMESPEQAHMPVFN
jgi:serine/threonine-protein kinase